jgi:hypothetical protein
MLFHFTAQYAPRGDIGRYSDKRIAAGMDWSGSVSKLIEALTTTGWVDRHAVARLVVHDWSDHADRVTLQRLGRKGQRPLESNQIDTGNVCTQSDTKTRTLPEPLPLPVPHPHPQGGNGDGPLFQSEYPLILAEIRRHDPAIDGMFVLRLVQEVTQFCLSSPKFPQSEIQDIDDRTIAKACAESYATGPRTHGAGLLLKRVPHIIETWALQE